MKNPDLTIFRNASLARKQNIVATGGEVFQAAATPSDMAVLWGESFGAKERKFLRELMASETIAFSLKDTYQIHVRTLWHANSISSGPSMESGLRRRGKFALLLHDLKGELTTSWCFAKFIRPLYRKGFSVIACDLPGFGKSSVAQVASCPLSAWQGQESHVISKIMEELSVAKCQILAVGSACGMLMRVLQSSPHRMAHEHVLINPVFDRNQLFAHAGNENEPPPGAKLGWQDSIKAKQQTALVDLLRTTNVKMWCLFDRECSYRDLNNPNPSKALLKEWQNTVDTHQMLLEAGKNEFVAQNLKVTEITKNDLCEAGCGKRIPVRMFIPCRALKASVANFLANYEHKPWQHTFKPTHIAHQTGYGRSSFLGHTGTTHDENENRFDDSDDEESEKSGPKASMRAGGLPAERALALIGGMSAKAAVSGSTAEVGESKLRALTDKASEVMDLALVAERASKKREEQSELRRTRQMGKSTSAAALLVTSSANASSRHSLSAAASIAAGRLQKSGAIARSGAVAAEAQRDLKTMNWTKVPFESDLSYGVRKMFLDAFEASVETFKEETDKEFSSSAQFQGRTGLRIDR